MMKNFLKRFSSLALAVLLIVALAVPAAAAGSYVTFDKADKKSSATIGNGTAYHATDLFANFKNVMPGDSLTQEVTIYNKVSGSSYINVYLKAIPHSKDSQASYSRDQAGDEGKTGENMDAFLSKMNLTIKAGGKTIYSGPANEAGNLSKGVNLGKINYKRSMNLTAELNVDIEKMDNEFQDHVGEIDWVFYADIIEGKNLIQTGQLNWPIPVLGTLGCGLIFLGFWMNRKKKKHE